MLLHVLCDAAKIVKRCIHARYQENEHKYENIKQNEDIPDSNLAATFVFCKKNGRELLEENEPKKIECIYARNANYDTVERTEHGFPADIKLI